MSDRKIMDCRKFPSESQCSVTISGTEEEVIPLAMHHAIDAHGHADTPELKDEIKAMLEDEK